MGEPVGAGSPGDAARQADLRAADAAGDAHKAGPEMRSAQETGAKRTDPDPDDADQPGPDQTGPDQPGAEQPGGEVAAPERAGPRWSRESRRALLRRACLVAAGAGLGAVAFAEAADVLDRNLPIRGGAAGATEVDRGPHSGAGQIAVTWRVQTDRKLVALTFDDGPQPNWTELTLDTLDRYDVPATFFMVGQRALKNPGVVHGRMARHEAANHSWRHNDLARADAQRAGDDLRRSHDAIAEVTGQEPALLRPPYGHLGGGALLAAARMNYRVVLWSQQMVESEFPGDPAGHARHIIDQMAPGTILLAHNVGKPDRLVALRGLPRMIEGLRERGYEFVTVSQLLGETSRSV
ncbi:polysaccharide deacetylase family protein [Rhizomonospora bruguierae]|uniref:polysaccharide deacetylase family protein n=1 Tax=Rhizomonospora bruguierae TaxID=1581705 RepID=UPI0020BF360D|nr:polysaccharide deacetylase family protein [Micromonospora sp. NBRC 107566]